MCYAGLSRHLLVFERNAAARRCSERHGGDAVAWLTKPMPDGGVPCVVRYQ